MLGGINVAVGGNRIIYVVKPDKSKGAAFLHYLGLLREPSTNVCRLNSLQCSLDHVNSRRDQRVTEGATVIFRSCRLFDRVAILRGIVRKLIAPQGIPGVLTRAVTASILRGINVTSGTKVCPDRLSKKRRRQINVTHTVTLSPRLLLFSRPASTLSPRLIKSILGIVQRLTSANRAVVVIARRVRFTRRITSGIIFVTSNMIIRTNAPTRIFSSPGRRQAGRFLVRIHFGATI